MNVGARITTLVLATTHVALGAGSSGAKIEFKMSTADAQAGCAQKGEFREFLRGLSAWRSLVNEVDVVLPTSISKSCGQTIVSKLTSQGFIAHVSRRSNASDVRVQGRLVSNVTHQAGPRASAEAAHMANQRADQSAIQSANKSDVAETTTPQSQTEKAPTSAPESGDAEVLAKASIGDSKREADEVGKTRDKPEEQQASAVRSASESPKTDEIARWMLSWGPSYLMINGTGIDGTVAGLNLARFGGSYLVSPAWSVVGDLLIPLNVSSTLPSATLLHVEAQRVVRGRRETLLLKDVEPSFQLRALGGLLYFSQDPSVAAAIRGNTNLLSEVATPYVGVLARKTLGRDLALSGRYALILVFPLSDTKFTLSSEFGIRVDRNLQDYTLFLSIDWGNYKVNYTDPLLGSTQATYLQLHLGLSYGF